LKRRTPRFIFERFDLQRNRRLGEEQPLGRLAKTELLGHNPEDLEAEVFQLRHILIIHGQILSKPAPYYPVSLILFH
jgi:hypothetical protein